MNRDQTVPVLVGISQLEQRVADPAQAKEPLALMIDAVRAAAADAGSNNLLNARDVGARDPRHLAVQEPGAHRRTSGRRAQRRNRADALRRQLRAIDGQSERARHPGAAP